MSSCYRQHIGEVLTFFIYLLVGLLFTIGVEYGGFIFSTHLFFFLLISGVILNRINPEFGDAVFVLFCGIK